MKISFIFAWTNLTTYGYHNWAFLLFHLFLWFLRCFFDPHLDLWNYKIELNPNLRLKKTQKIKCIIQYTVFIWHVIRVIFICLIDFIEFEQLLDNCIGDRQHHCRWGRIRNPQWKKCCYKHKTEHQPLRIRTEKQENFQSYTFVYFWYLDCLNKLLLIHIFQQFENLVILYECARRGIHSQ
jgi:hypothetical protein